MTHIIGNLEWQLEHSPDRMRWEEATNYAKSLGDGWRLPTIKELASLVDYSVLNPAISEPFVHCTETAVYWSSTTYADYTSYAWYVYFHNGYVDNSYKANSYYVRCVRSVEVEE